MELSLLALYILEKDNNDDILWSWIYPKIDDDEEKFIFNKCNRFFQTIPFIFLKRKNFWYYILIKNVPDIQSNILKNIKQFAIILKACEYNPNKFQKITNLLSQKYQSVADPVQVQKLYWEIYTGNTLNNSNDNGLLQIKEHLKLKTTGNIKDLIKTFELETILIYNALLLKKRVIVYHQNLKDLISVIAQKKTRAKFTYYMKAIPSLLVCNRNPTDYLYPFVEDNQDEILELKSSKWFVAGTTNKSLLSNDQFDLFVNIPDIQIQISPNAKESFTMTKTHKEIAVLMVQLSQDGSITDLDIETTLSEKTDAILTQMKSLGTIQTDNSNEKMISLEYLRSKKLSVAVENFLFNLALAENIIIL